MDYIILDIEFNGRKFASELPMEVIEIGAVRLDPSLHIKDEFSSVIKPVHFSKLNAFIKQKTGIPQEAIDEARGFKEVITDFINWLNQSEAYLLLTWGGEDLKRIVLDTRMHHMDDAYWMAADYLDLLKGFLRSHNLTNDVSVESALQHLDIAASGSAHRALDDARMTAEIFRKTFNDLDFSRVLQYTDKYSNSKERRMVKNAIRAMQTQKITPNWEQLLEKHLIDKVSLDDPRKVTELHDYFLAEVAKLQQPAH